MYDITEQDLTQYDVERWARFYYDEDWEPEE